MGGKKYMRLDLVKMRNAEKGRGTIHNRGRNGIKESQENDSELRLIQEMNKCRDAEETKSQLIEPKLF